MMINAKLKEKIVTFLRANGAKKICIFGSYARGEQGPDSDLDILVEFAEKKSLLDIIGIEQELTDETGIKVDLLTERSISPYIIDEIKKEMAVVYG